ncbi:MAG: cytochrome c [Thermonemataceae bacterium]|nr:cytochrome c [Thermonemataceae bacterium]
MKNKVWLGSIPVVLFVGLLVGNALFFKTKEQGKLLYEQHCASCHMEKGEGLAQLIPPISKSDWLKNNPSKVACVIMHGQKGAIKVNGREYNQEMPANTQLSEIEIHNLVNYLFTNFENNIEKRTLEQIRQDLTTCN